MSHRTPRGWEVRMRVGGGVRLECTAPASLTETQFDKRRAALKTLRDDLLPLGDHATIRRLLEGVAVSPSAQAAALEETAVRRFAADELKKAMRVVKEPHLQTFGTFALH